MTTTMPDVIDRYLRAHDRLDTDASLATFAPDAAVVDDGHTYVGLDAIRGWLDHGASEYTYTRTLTGVDGDGADTFVVHNHLAGDFPGGEVDLRFRFELSDGLIRRLEIAP